MSKIAIMQPYFLPYVGYWNLLAAADEFVFFDIVQYNKKSWMNRNRILDYNQHEHFQYLSVPVKKHKKGTQIQHVLINQQNHWQASLLGKLTIYKSHRARYYSETLDFISDLLNTPCQCLNELCVLITTKICELLEIPLQAQLASELNMDTSDIQSPGDWALTICSTLRKTQYINPHGGAAIFDEQKYHQKGVSIGFVKPRLSPYEQSANRDFVPGLSIVDLLMFNDLQTVKDLVHSDFDILSQAEILGVS